MSDGTISGDIISKFAAWVMNFLAGGTTIDQQIVSNGDSILYSVLKSTNRIVPSFTVLNSGAYSITWGVGGNANHTLLSGASFTKRWCTPAHLQMVVKDGGSGKGMTVDVF